MNITYRYKRAGNYPGNGNINANTTRHHIISYVNMLTYAIVLFKYCAIEKMNQTQIDAMDSFFKTRGAANWRGIVGDFKKENLEETVRINAGILQWICWAEANLFIGPSGLYRLDDPSQKMENFPLFMPQEQKKLASETRESWNRICSSRIVGEEGISISINIDERNLDDFISSFLKYINCIKPDNIYHSSYKDWVVADITDNKNYYYNFIIKHSQAPTIFKRYRFVLRTEDMKLQKSGVCLYDANANDFPGVMQKFDYKEDELAVKF